MGSMKLVEIETGRIEGTISKRALQMNEEPCGVDTTKKPQGIFDM